MYWYGKGDEAPRSFDVVGLPQGIDVLPPSIMSKSAIRKMKVSIHY